MEKVIRRLAFVQEDLTQMFPSVSDYDVQRQMLDVLASIMDLKNIIEVKGLKR